ncbi:unnamed protein product [Mytilus coruscus]|uniref:Uncharacterized protein n=1 Tax=Mytilus coruscus TaxID=42192 RepID=A0A6J8DQ21_MYTCO|nr:unnamed protein product [Mytilus coruscus]
MLTLENFWRLLIRLRKLVEKEDAKLSEFLHPSHFKTVIKATKDEACYDEQTHLLKIPSLAIKIETSLRICATIRKRNGLEEGDENLTKESSSFFDRLCEDNWAEEKTKRNKMKRIPLTSDCRLLTVFEGEKQRCIQGGPTGHDVRIHREFYRLPQHTLEIAQVCKLLISLENGEFSGLGGKSLSEIDANLL